VLAIEGDSAVLGGQLIGHGVRRVATGPVSTVRLMFTTEGGLVALTGELEPGPMPDTARFLVTDDAHVPQARQSSRLAIRLQATVVSADGPPQAARVVDISKHGIGVRDWSAPIGTQVQLAIIIPPGGRRLGVHAAVSRTFPGGAGLTIDERDCEAAEAFSDLVVAYRASVIKGQESSQRRFRT